MQVKISPKQVFNAVRNILANEMKLDPVEVRRDVQKSADALINKEVLDYISKSGYGQADIYNRVKTAMNSRMNDLDKIVKEVVRQLVMEELHQQAVEVVEAIIKDGMELKIGWGHRKVKVKLAEKPLVDPV